MNLGLEKSAKICLKKGRVQKKPYTRNMFEKDIKVLDLRKACRYLWINDSSDLEQKNEQGKFKKEYLRRCKISFWHRIKHRIK